MLNQSSLSPQQPVKEIFKMTQEELNQILALPDIALIWDQFVFDRVYMKKADVSVENLTRPRYLLLVGGGSEIVSPKEEYYIKIRMLFLNQYYPRIYQLFNTLFDKIYSSWSGIHYNMEPAKYIAQRFLTRYEAEFTDYLSGKKDKESIKEGLEHLADAVLFDKLLPYPLVYKASLERERPVNPSPSLQKQIKPEIVAKFVSKKAEQLLTIFNKYEKVINIINKYSPVLIEELSHRLTETMLNSFKRMNEPTLVSFLTKFAEQRKHKMTVSMPIEKDEKTKSTTFKKCN